MAIRFQHVLDVARGPEQAFAGLGDLSATPKWPERCTGIEKLAPCGGLSTRLGAGPQIDTPIDNRPQVDNLPYTARRSACRRPQHPRRFLVILQ